VSDMFSGNDRQEQSVRVWQQSVPFNIPTSTAGRGNGHCIIPYSPVSAMYTHTPGSFVGAVCICQLIG
jgi:hypothetical protein